MSDIKRINGKYYGFHPEGEKGGAMLAGLCALIVDEKDGSVIDTVLYEDMDSDDLDEFMDKVDDNQIGANTYLYYFSDNEEADGSMKTGMVTVDLDGDSYQFQFRKSGGADSRGRSVHGVDGDYIYKYGQRMKADSDQKYVLVRADGDINDDGITVKKYDGSDVRKLNEITQGISNSDDGKTKVYYGFGTRDAGWYLVNTSGKIQDGKKSGVKDGDDYYWYINEKDNIIEQYLSDDPEIDVVSDWKGFFTRMPERMEMEEKKAILASIHGVSLASDAFFPFADNIIRASRSGVSYISQPGGSMRDDLAIEAADRAGIVMFMTGRRLFTH